MRKLSIPEGVKLIGLALLIALALLMPAPAQGQGAGLIAGDDFVVNVIQPNDQRTPSVAALGNGGFVIAWEDRSGHFTGATAYTVVARLFGADGHPVGEDFLVSTNPHGNNIYPSVTGLAGHPEGRFVIAWYADGLRAQLYDIDGNKVGNEIIVVGGPIAHLQVAGLDNGRFVVAWESHNPKHIFVREYDGDGNPVAGIIQVNSIQTGLRYRPTVSGLSSGSYMVAWQEDGADPYAPVRQIRYRIFDSAGTTSLPEAPVDPDGTPGQLHPTAATLANGTFVIAWLDYSGSIPGGVGQDVHARLFRANGAPASGIFRVNEVTGNDLIQARVAAIGDGGFVVAWRTEEDRPSGININIKARRFASNGAAMSADFFVNEAASWADRYFPSLAPYSCRGFLVSWQDSRGILQSGHDIRARIYEPDASCCDPETAYQQGRQCLCRFTGMVPVSTTACACPAGMELGVDPATGRPACVPIPPPSCDPATTVQEGGECRCLIPAMERVDEWRCACPGNGRLYRLPGRPWMCLGDREDERRCLLGQVFNSELGQCVRVPTTCPDTQVMIGGRCTQIVDRPITGGGSTFTQVDTDSTPSCAPPPPGMRFWLAFDGNYTDLIGSLPGTPSSGVSLISDVPAGHEAHAGRLPVNGRIDFAANPAFGLGTGDFTLDAWVRTTEVSPDAVPVIDTRVGSAIASVLGYSSHVSGVFVFIYQGRLGIQMADGSFTNFLSDSFVANGEWRHVAISVRRGDPQGGRMFVDGHLVHTFNPTARAGSLGNANPMTIGFDRAFNRHSGAIDIDEVEIFHRALEAIEILPLAQLPKCRREERDWTRGTTTGTGTFNPPVFPPQFCPAGFTVQNGECQPPVTCEPPMTGVAGSCICPEGSELTPQGGCRPVDPVCDPLTTLEHGGACVCRWRGMTPVSSERCACPAGTELRPDIGCIPIPLPHVTNGGGGAGSDGIGRQGQIDGIADAYCDPATTVLRDGACVCRSEDMTRVDAARCACPPRHVFSPAVGRCTPLFCPPPTRLNDERTECVCPAGQALRDGVCVETGRNLDRAIEILAPVIRDGARAPSRDPGPQPQPQPNPNCTPGGPVPC